MPHRKAVEEASRKRGREISPELIEELLGALVPGAIKSIQGFPGKIILKGRNISSPLLAGSRKAGTNLNRPLSLSKDELRRNIGGKRPPDTELEALALQKQLAQKVAKSDKAAIKERLKARTKFEDRISKLSPIERARFEELSNQLRETVRRGLDVPKRTIDIKKAIQRILDAEE